MRTFETNGALVARIDCPVGEVVVATHDAPRAEVDVRALRNDDTTREAVENTRVELRPGAAGDELLVEVPQRTGSFFGREPRIRVDVKVPHGSALAFTTASADVSATGRYGDVRGKTASGDVSVETAAEVRVETASGDLRFDTDEGDAEVKAASGDVRVGRVGGTFTGSVVSGDLRAGVVERGGSVAAVSGDVDVDALASGALSVRSVSGDVTLGVPEGTRVHVDVTTVSGDLKSDVALSDEPGGEGDGPLVEISGRTVSGDLRVRRAKRLAAAR